MTNSRIPDIDDIIHGVLAAEGLAEGPDEVTYTAPGGATVACRVYLDRSGQTINDAAEIVGQRVEISILRADVPAPKRDGLLTIGAEVWKLEAKIPDEDEGLSTWVVARV